MSRAATQYCLSDRQSINIRNLAVGTIMQHKRRPAWWHITATALNL